MSELLYRSVFYVTCIFIYRRKNTDSILYVKFNIVYANVTQYIISSLPINCAKKDAFINIMKKTCEHSVVTDHFYTIRIR